MTPRFQDPQIKRAILSQAMRQIEKLLLELEESGKDLSSVKLKYFKKTHYHSCCCPPCLEARSQRNPALKGLREMGFKVFFHEDSDAEK